MHKSFNSILLKTASFWALASEGLCLSVEECCLIFLAPFWRAAKKLWLYYQNSRPKLMYFPVWMFWTYRRPNRSWLSFYLPGRTCCRRSVYQLTS